MLQVDYFLDCFILIQISLCFVPNDPINNKIALIDIMAWPPTVAPFTNMV